jgi:uracil-DNA glycosylase
MASLIPKVFIELLPSVHASWRPIIAKGLEAVAEADPAYLPALAQDVYLPTLGRIFAAFSIPLESVRYVLMGEGPYPREESATGVCFMDGAVESLWSEKGLSKQVNRATSLRNFMKMLLVADGYLTVENASGEAMIDIASKMRSIGSPFIQTLTELQGNLTKRGFLLLNATLVFRQHVPPIKDAKAWRPFMRTVLVALAEQGHGAHSAPTLVLWGKIAEQLDALPETHRLPKLVSEHPYNISFIGNQTMQRLFGPMQLLRK